MVPATAASAFRDLLAHRSFMRLWLARFATSLAGQMLLVAIGWQMYDLTHSAWDLGLVGLVQFMPALALTLPAGHVVDQHHRGRILGTCLCVQTVVALVLALATLGWGHGPWASREVLLLLSVVLGAVRAFQMPALQALTPALLPGSLLARGLAFNASGAQAAMIAGPALGGVLYVAGAQVVYGVAFVCFGLAAALALRVRYEHAPRRAEPVTLQILFAGVAFVWASPVILGAISLDLFAVLLGGATALLPMFARDMLHVGAWGLGLLRGAPAAGALAMSIVLTRRPLRRRAGRRLLGAVAVFGLCMIVFGLSRSFWLSLAVLAISGAADMVSVVVRQTLVQLETPEAMRGRVSAVSSIFIGASNQLGEFESGATAALLGPVGSVVAGGVGTLLVAALWRRWFRPLAERNALEREGTP
ncbi:MAG: MFS transporter [Pelomonas sp.]|nr:MFS transporter [Roseateles sp.]